MNLPIERALFGIHPTVGHALLGSTTTKPIAWLETISDYPRASFEIPEWDPFYIGSKVKNTSFFSILRVARDDKAPRRGSVITRAVLIEIEYLAQVQLRDLWVILEDENWTTPLSPTIISKTGINTYPEQVDEPDYAFSYTIVQSQNNPVILVDLNLIPQIWNFWDALPQKGREEFSFRTIFDPDALHNSGFTPKLVLVPDSLKSRWHNLNSLIVPKAEDLLLRHLAGDRNPVILPWLESLTAWKWDALNTLSILFLLLKQLEEGRGSVNVAAAALENLITLEIQAEFVCEQQYKLWEFLQKQLVGASIDDLKRVAGLIPLTEQFALQNIIQSRASKLIQDEVQSMSDLFTRCGTAQSWWIYAIQTAIKSALRSGNPQLIEAIWAGLCSKNSTTFFELVADSWETQLAASIAHQTLPNVFIENLKYRQWWLLFASIHLQKAPTEQCFQDLLQNAPLDASERIVRAYQLIAGTRELICAAQNMDRRDVWEHAGTYLNNDHSGWEALEVTEAGIQIWTIAGLKAKDPWGGQAKRLLPLLVSELLNDLQVPLQLLERLGTTSDASLLAFPNRSSVWKKLPSLARKSFLMTTANDWLRQGESGEFIETELSETILELVSDGKFNLDGATRVVTALPDLLQDAHIEKIVKAAISQSGNLGKSESILKATGRVMVRRNRWALAQRLCDEFRPDSRPIVTTFVESIFKLLTSLQKFFQFFSRSLNAVEEIDRTEVFEQWCIDSVPDRLKEFWERAGGRVADLPHGNTDAEQWRSAFREIRSGSKVTYKKLLEITLREYPESQILKKLRPYLN